MTTTRYLEILSQQSPFPAGLDANGRTIFSCNFTALAAAPIADFKNEILALITTAGLGTRGTNLFVGRYAKIPDGDGPFVVFVSTAGFAPRETHDGAKYEYPGFQILVVAAVYSTAETRALAVWRALDGARNTTVTGL